MRPCSDASAAGVSKRNRQIASRLATAPLTGGGKSAAILEKVLLKAIHRARATPCDKDFECGRIAKYLIGVAMSTRVFAVRGRTDRRPRQLADHRDYWAIGSHLDEINRYFPRVVHSRMTILMSRGASTPQATARVFRAPLRLPIFGIARLGGFQSGPRSRRISCFDSADGQSPELRARGRLVRDGGTACRERRCPDGRGPAPRGPPMRSRR